MLWQHVHMVSFDTAWHGMVWYDNTWVCYVVAPTLECGKNNQAIILALNFYRALITFV